MNLFEIPEKEEQKKQNAISFINAAQIIIDNDGLENISIRKIALEAGFHNSTIYLYFQNSDELVMLASMKYFREYSHSLKLQSEWHLPPNENFIKIWELFADTIFERPNLFYNFFFGKLSDDISVIMDRYYNLFPEEREEFSRDIEEMYFEKNLLSRSLRILQPLVSEKNNVTAENIHMLNEITTACSKYKLEQKRSHMDWDTEKLKQELLADISYIIGI